MFVDTLKIEEKLAEKYKYKKLPAPLSKKYRDFFVANIPEFLKIEGDDILLTTKNGTPLCQGYDRIVVGDYGAFVEFTKPYQRLTIEKGQEYRLNDPKYSSNVKFLWLTIVDGSKVKIYKQQKCVMYADYRPQKFYVSVHEVLG